MQDDLYSRSKVHKCMASPYQLPSHPDSIVEDRFSVCEQFSDQLEVPHWAFIKALLEKPVRSVENLLEIISHNQYDLEFTTLVSVFHNNFSVALIPPLVKAALRMPKLFPTGLLDVLNPGEARTISLTREQIACLLSHMFLCTLKTPLWNKHWCNFGIWYSSNSNPASEYLKCLLSYFSQLDALGRPPNPLEEVCFQRSVLTSPPNWRSSTSCFSADILCLSRSLHPEQGCNIEVSFANRDVSFGVSGTQEEVKMGMSPEACVAVLLSPSLEDNEALLIKGAKQVGVHEGIGRDVRFTGVCNDVRDWRSRCIIAIDAMELDCLGGNGHEIAELKESVLVRELNKAYCGFSSVSEDRVAIATGHWGCGAFGGNKYLKSLIQAMAASEANKRLVFHEIKTDATGLTFMEELAGIVEFLSKSQLSVSQLFAAIEHLDRESSCVFDDIKTFCGSCLN